jgi:phospholipid transport system transporter-binding protein
MIERAGDGYRLVGPITMANVPALLEQCSGLCGDGDRVVIDLSGVDEVDSAAVSLLLEWKRLARRDGRKVRFINLPANLESLIALYGVGELLHDV